MSIDISGKEAHTILTNMLSILSPLCDYLESEDEIKICLRQNQNYYNSVKKYLKSDHACKSIEEETASIDNNIKYLCHYHFFDVTTIYVLGDNIIKGSNCRLKRGQCHYFHKYERWYIRDDSNKDFENIGSKKSQVRIVLLI